MKALTIGIALTLVTASLAAQDQGYVASARSSWNRTKRLVSASAAAMPESGYASKPTPEVRSFGEIIGHLANEHYMICSGFKNETNPRAGVDYEKTTAKADLVKALNDSIAYCDGGFAGARDDARATQPIATTSQDTPFGLMLLNVTHDSEHYGNLVTYLRLKGFVPPSSQATR
jgi:uncharacterized damage-inducible protein DinB